MYSKLETIRDILKSKIKTTHRSVHFIEDDDGIPKIKISTSKEGLLDIWEVSQNEFEKDQ